MEVNITKKAIKQLCGIKDWSKDFWKEITYPFKRFFKGIKRIIEFTPIIWKTYDWDYHYAIDLFAFQLERIAKSLESPNSLGVDSKQRAMRIRTALKLMKKVYDDEYGMEYFDIMEKKYGKYHMDFVKTDIDSDTYQIVTRYGEVDQYTEEEYSKIKEEENKLFNESQKKQEKAEDVLWKLIRHNLRWWWD